MMIFVLTLSILLSTVNAGEKGADTFTLSSYFPQVSAIKLADVDGDSDLDILAAGADANALAWWEYRAPNPSSNSTIPQWTEHPIAYFYDASCLATGDIDGDGDLDIAACSTAEDVVNWYQNLKTELPEFLATDIFMAYVYELYEIEGGASIQLMDSWYLDYLNNLKSTILPALFAEYGEDPGAVEMEKVTTFIRERIATQKFEIHFREHFVSDFAQTPQEVSLADFDGDGTLDLGISYLHSVSPEQPNLFILKNLDGKGESFHASDLLNDQHVVRININGNGLAAHQAIDFDNDGDQDIVYVIPWGEKQFWWARNEGDDSFTQIPIGGNPQTDASFTFTLNDFDGNGTIDLATQSSELSPFHQVNVITRRDLAGVEWNPPFAIDSLHFGGSGTSGISSADMDGDGLMDIVASSYFFAPALVVFRNQGQGQFGSAEFINNGLPAYTVQTEDYNQDGKQDIIVGTWGFNVGEIKIFDNPY